MRGSMAAFTCDYLSAWRSVDLWFTRGGLSRSYQLLYVCSVDWTGNSELYQEYCRLMALYNEYPGLSVKGIDNIYPQPDVHYLRNRMVKIGVGCCKCT